jgi:transcriptional regulator with XRE-family HTH domain
MVKTIEAVYKEIGKRITKERKRQGMSQERIAAASGIDRSHIGFIEQGRRKPTLATLYKIAAALNVSLEELFRGL